MSKTLWIIIIFLFSYISASSQEQETYFKGKDLKKYEGKWIGVHEKDTLIIILKYNEHADTNSKVCIDAIVGWHRYKKNGIIESSTITEDSLIFTEKSIMIGVDIGGNEIASFNEKNRRNGSTRLLLTLSNETPNILIWEMGNTFPQEYNKVMINGDTIPKYPEEHYSESKLAKVKEWKLVRVTN